MVAYRAEVEQRGTHAQKFKSYTQIVRINTNMAEADWDEVTYLRKKPVRAGDAKAQKVLIRVITIIVYKGHSMAQPLRLHGPLFLI